MVYPSYTADEDQVLLSYTADLDPLDFKSKRKQFTARFKQAALKLPGRTPDALRKRWLRLHQSRITPDPPKAEPAPPVQSVPVPPHKLIPERELAKREPIHWEDSFIKPPSKDQLMGRR